MIINVTIISIMKKKIKNIEIFYLRKKLLNLKFKDKL
jgi:hypothetical protein